MRTRSEQLAGTVPEFALRVFDEVRDWLALGLAAAVVVLGYYLAAEVWLAVTAGIMVMVVRISAGLLLARHVPPIPPRWTLTLEEQDIATLIGAGSTDPEIAEQRKLSKKGLAKKIEGILTKLGYKSRDKIGSWAYWVGLTDPPKGPPKPWWEIPRVRAALTAGSFISLGWALYNIAKLIWPSFFAR
jgi:DNA-binding CsgD family transcriptional regulator